ncbi:MAG: sugar ABC transporter substrate-binding protein [Alphaproteobacteria bacterium]
MKKFLLRASAVAGLVASMAAGAVQAQDGPTIAVLPKTIIGDVFMTNLANFAQAKGEELGANVEIFGVASHSAVEEQVSIMETLISRGVDAIILAAVDSRGLGPAVNRATEAGIPVILADSGVEGANYVTVVQTDNVRASGLAADYAAVLLSYQGQVAQLEGETSSETAQLRRQGFHEGIAKYPDIELVTSITGHWTTPGGVDATEAILRSHPDVDLIFASSDLMAVGAAIVLERAGRDDVIVIGFDGIGEGTDLIIEGKAAGDVAQNARGMGELSVEIAMQIINGERTADDFPPFIDSGMTLVHPWNVHAYRESALGIPQPE